MAEDAERLRRVLGDPAAPELVAIVDRVVALTRPILAEIRPKGLCSNEKSLQLFRTIMSTANMWSKSDDPIKRMLHTARIMEVRHLDMIGLSFVANPMIDCCKGMLTGHPIDLRVFLELRRKDTLSPPAGTPAAALPALRHHATWLAYEDPAGADGGCGAAAPGAGAAPGAAPVGGAGGAPNAAAPVGGAGGAAAPAASSTACRVCGQEGHKKAQCPNFLAAECERKRVAAAAAAALPAAAPPAAAGGGADPVFSIRVGGQRPLGGACSRPDCDKKAAFLCAGCPISAAYCGKDCQRLHWPKHRLTHYKAFDSISNPEGGRRKRRSTRRQRRSTRRSSQRQKSRSTRRH